MNEDSMKQSLQSVKWGILGTGTIAHQFVQQLLQVPNIELVGVASRSLENAKKFAECYQTKAFETYEALCTTSDADVVYICTPTRFHCEHAHLVLDNNKAVLCEKPFTCNQKEVASVIEKAKAKQLFCMEAMWMRFNPYVQKAKAIIASQELGLLRTMHGELGYQKDLKKLGTASHGQGASLAFGCYLLSLSIYLFGKPQAVTANLIQNPQGGDETGSVLIQYPDQVVSAFFSEAVTLSNEINIFAQHGCLKLNSPFIDAPSLNVVNLRELAARSASDKIRRKLSSLMSSVTKSLKRKKTLSSSGIGFQREVQEVNKCLRNSLIESDIMPWSETLLIHEIIDSILDTSEWRGEDS